MKIQNLKVNSYGKLEDKEIDLTDNINIIYGKNESGKSTILRFMVNMFYGASKNKKGKNISDYDKYKPWNKSDFSGKIKYKLDNGKTYEVYREFGKKNPIIYNENMEDITKQFNIDKNTGSEFFHEQTQIDEHTFLSTIASEQNEVRLEKNSQNMLIQKISNLVETGDDSISLKKALDKLNKKQLEEVGTDRSREKPINIIKQKIEQMLAEKEQLDDFSENKNEIEAEKIRLSDAIIVEEAKNTLIRKIRRLNDDEALEKEKIKIKQDNMSDYEIREKILQKNLEDENDRLQKSRETYSKEKIDKKYIISLIILIIVNIINAFIGGNMILKTIVVGALIIDIIITLIMQIVLTRKNINKNKEFKRSAELINAEKSKIQEELDKLCEERDNKKKEIDIMIEEINEKFDLEKDSLINEYQDKVSIDVIGDLFEAENIYLQYELSQNKINDYKIELHKLTIDSENVEEKFEKAMLIDEKLQALNEEYEELKNLNSSFNIARDVLENAYVKMKSSISPKFTNDLSNTVNKISNGKYKNVRFNDEEGIVVEVENGSYINAHRLSTGTIDQLYISLRLAILNEISNENMPIILDESFAYYDSERLENVLKYLAEEYPDKQIIIFSCTEREKDILNKLNIKFNFVSLGTEINDTK